jgi:hypothetical protein
MFARLSDWYTLTRAASALSLIERRQAANSLRIDIRKTERLCEARHKKREANEARTRTPFKRAGLLRHATIAQVIDKVSTHGHGAAAVRDAAYN